MNSEGKEVCVRRSNLQGRIRRCRGSLGASESRCAWAVGGLREQDTPPGVCEMTFEHGISEGQRAYVLNQDDLFCIMCGIAPGDIDDLTGNRAEFHIGLIAENKCGDEEKLSNIRALCSTCYQGSKSIKTVKPPAIWLLSQIRRAGQEEQRAVLDWLLKKFKE